MLPSNVLSKTLHALATILPLPQWHSQLKLSLRRTPRSLLSKLKSLLFNHQYESSAAVVGGGIKRGRNSSNRKPIPVTVCTTCGNRGHETCWDGLEAAQDKHDKETVRLASLKATRKKTLPGSNDRKPSNKETKAYSAAVVANKHSVGTTARDYSKVSVSVLGPIQDENDTSLMQSSR